VFININGKTPSRYNKNRQENILGIWLSTQKANYNEKQFIMKNEDIIKIWKEFIEEYKNYLLTGEELWLNNLDKLKVFININGKTPSQYNKNRQENILGSWLSTQKRTYNNKQNIMKNEHIQKIWEDFIEEYKKFIITK